jgi:ribonuclease HI
MPWIRATLRGQKVWARALVDGALDVRGGRVEVRYQPNDGRAYHAAAGNLAPEGGVLPDDTCGPAEPASPGGAARATGGASAPGGGKRAASAPGGAKAGQRGVVPHASHGEGATIAYADGACTGNPGPAGLGVVVLDPVAATRTEIGESLGHGTNNVAELTAIERALEASDPGRRLAVYTDSKYAIGVLSLGWKAKANQELVARIRGKLAGRDVRFVLVPGHAGIELNERADALAREAVATRRSRRATSGVISWPLVKI